MKRTALTLFCCLAFAAMADPSPYAAHQGRPIKALSDADIRAYREAAGMGLALAAELNRYPGPKHVLELAPRLALSSEQQEKVTAVYTKMRAEAAALGEKIIEEESRLDDAFASASVDSDSLKLLTEKIGLLQGRLRYGHLLAHLETRALLSRHQNVLYQQLRGYGGSHEGHRHEH